MRTTKIEQSDVDTDAHWVKKSDKSLFGYKQHTLVDDIGLVMVVKNKPMT